MPKSFQQKLKILYLMRVFSEKTDEAHPMSVKDLISYWRVWEFMQSGRRYMTI